MPSYSYGFLWFGEKAVNRVVPQNVNVVSDSGHTIRLAKLVEQVKETQKMVDQTRSIVNQTNRLVQIAGDPKSVIHSMKDINAATRQLDQIFRTPTTHEVRQLVNGTDSLTRSGYHFKGEVGDSFLAGKKQHKRRADLYQTYSLFESSYDNFENLVHLDRNVQKREIERQEQLLNDLAKAETQAEVDKITVALQASKGVQEASSFQVMKQKMELDMQKMARDMEREKLETARWEEHQEALRQAREQLKEREALYAKHVQQQSQSRKFIQNNFNML